MSVVSLTDSLSNKIIAKSTRLVYMCVFMASLFVILSTFYIKESKADVLSEKHLKNLEWVVFGEFDRYRYMGKLEESKYGSAHGLTYLIPDELKNIPIIQCNYVDSNGHMSTKYYWFGSFPEGTSSIEDEVIIEMVSQIGEATKDCPK